MPAPLVKPLIYISNLERNREVVVRQLIFPKSQLFEDRYKSADDLKPSQAKLVPLCETINVLVRPMAAAPSLGISFLPIL